MFSSLLTDRTLSVSLTKSHIVRPIVSPTHHLSPPIYTSRTAGVFQGSTQEESMREESTFNHHLPGDGRMDEPCQCVIEVVCFCFAMFVQTKWNDKKAKKKKNRKSYRRVQSLSGEWYPSFEKSCFAMSCLGGY